MALLLMNNNKSLESHPQKVKTVIFKIANYLFALPLTAIEKITLFPSEENHHNNTNLINFDNRTLTILNLHQQLTSTNQKQKELSHTGKFLIITQNPQGESYGIKVDTLPNLIDLPWSSIEQLSTSYRQHQILGLANYVSVLPSQTGKKLIFLLDLEVAGRVALANLSPETQPSHGEKQS